MVTGLDRGKDKEFAVINLAQTHLKEIKDRRLPEIDKVEKEVEARLKQEIRYWDSRAVILKEDEKLEREPELVGKMQNVELKSYQIDCNVEFKLKKNEPLLRHLQL